MSASNRIHAKGPFRHTEHKANSALIYPGMLIDIDANDEVAPHSVVGGKNLALFAAEDALQGKTIATIYEDDSIVTCYQFPQGSEVFALIADGQDLEIGDPVMSNGAGLLIALADASGADADWIIGYMMETADLTGSDTENTTFRVRVA